MTAEANATVGSHAPRLPWVDNVRTAVVILVVHFHSCITYSHVGDWYLKDGPEGTLVEKLPYIFWVFHLQSFFMGLLFFLAGAMVDGAIARHGLGPFLQDRVRRLAVPALFFMMFLHPLIVFGLLGIGRTEPDPYGLSAYANYLTSGQVFSGSGPLWFALALLLFSAALAASRSFLPVHAPMASGEPPKPRTLLIFAAGLAIATVFTRGFFPAGTSVFNFQLCYFPQYIAAFAAGVVAGKRGWLNQLAAERSARFFGYLALIGGPILLGVVLWLGGGPTEGPKSGEHGQILYFGGWNPQAYAAATWEQFTGLGLALGMMALFKRRFDRANEFSRWLASRSFAVYVFHAPILVWLALQYRSVPLDPISKIALLTASGLVASFAVADIVKRLPLFGRYF